MNKNLQKALKLSQKTGDRLIVFDSRGETEPFVVMPIDKYEDLVGLEEPIHELTEEQLLDKINRDIASWRAHKEHSKVSKPKFPNITNEYEVDDSNWEADDIYEEINNEYSEIEDQSEKFEDNYQFKVDEFGIKEQSKPKKKKKAHWQIPSERKEAAEEVIEEDRQYLEEVPF